jgi:hypothetical protein
MKAREDGKGSCKKKRKKRRERSQREESHARDDRYTASARWM